MSLVSSKELLYKAQKEKYGIGAFNVENMEMAQAVVEAAKEKNSPVIIQTTPSTIKYGSVSLFYSMIKSLADEVDVEIALHLDHGDSYELAQEVTEKGYTSVMIDGSSLNFEENIELTKKTVEMCHLHSVPVEAELGKVGGKEDGVVASDDSPYTDPDQAKEFVEKTGVDFLAVAIGTSHGIYKGEPRLDLNRLSEIREKVSVPLVLHGTSGVPDDTVKECIKRGICKINYATDLRVAYTNAVKNYLDTHDNVIDPKKFNKEAREAVKQAVMHKMDVVMSTNRG